VAIPGFTPEAAVRTRQHGLVVSALLPPGEDPNGCYEDCAASCHEGPPQNFRTCLSTCRTRCRSTGTTSPPPATLPLPASSGGLPVYGNYCGPGHGDPTYTTPPLDAVDAVCQAHDRCYDTRGYFNCGCDRALITAMPGAIIGTPSPAGKAAGALVAGFFAGWPCQCPATLCAPFIGCVTLPGAGGVGVGGAGFC
jgi:hypothetical protein